MQIDHPRKRVAEQVVDAIENVGLDPLVVIWIACLCLSMFYVYEWKSGRTKEDERSWRISFWVVTGVVTTVVLLVRVLHAC